jgi:hypothetical protein
MVEKKITPAEIAFNLSTRIIFDPEVDHTFSDCKDVVSLALGSPDWA